MSSKKAFTADDARSAYSKLRELMTDAAPPEAKRTEIEAQVQILHEQMQQKEEEELQLDALERRAELALSEGHVELFEKVCDWCRLGSVEEKHYLGMWAVLFERLHYVLQYRAPHSPKLSSRLAHSKHYFKAVALELHWNIANENELKAMIKSLIVLCSIAPEAIETAKKLYHLILKIFYTKRFVCSLIPLLSINLPSLLENTK